jgi:hypothetical protein
VVKAKKAVVSNATPFDTVKMLKPDEQTVPPDVHKWREELGKLPRHGAIMHLFLAIDAEGLDLSHIEDPAHLVVQDWGRSLQDSQNLCSFFIPSLLDPSVCPEGKHVIHVYSSGGEPYEPWEKLTPGSEECVRECWAGSERGPLRGAMASATRWLLLTTGAPRPAPFGTKGIARHCTRLAFIGRNLNSPLWGAQTPLLLLRSLRCHKQRRVLRRLAQRGPRGQCGSNGTRFAFIRRDLGALWRGRDALLSSPSLRCSASATPLLSSLPRRAAAREKSAAAERNALPHLAQPPLLFLSPCPPPPNTPPPPSFLLLPL